MSSWGPTSVRTVLDLLRNDELRGSLGERARTKVRERYDISVMAPKLVRTIDRMLAMRGESKAADPKSGSNEA